MPKRLLNNLSQNKKIKLNNTNFTHNTNLLHSRIIHYNLQTGSEIKTAVTAEACQKINMTANKSDEIKKEDDSKVTYLDTPVKSESDKKEYR
jgi:aspartate oxidase